MNSAGGRFCASRGDRPKIRYRDWLTLSLLLFFAFSMRCYRLQTPHQKIWDEKYYVPAAAVLVGGEKAAEHRRSVIPPLFSKSPDVNFEHPPLGKFLIGAGICLFGNRPLGWRIASVVAGCASLVCFYFLAFTLFQSPQLAKFSVFLLSFDFLHLVHSQLATLESFLFFFSVLMMLALLKIVRQSHPRVWATIAALSIAAAISVKYVMLLSGLAFLVLLFVLPCSLSVRQKTRWALCCLVGISGFYGLWYFWFASYGYGLGEWLQLQVETARLLLGPAEVHRYHSPPLAWLWNSKPIWYHFETQPFPHGILAMGNPLLWWLFIPSLCLVGYGCLSKKSFEDKFILIWFGITYLPLFLLLRERSGSTFIYYLIPCLAPLCLAVTWSVAPLLKKSWFTVIYATSIVVTTLFFLPVLWGTPLNLAYVKVLSWLVPFH